MSFLAKILKVLLLYAIAAGILLASSAQARSVHIETGFGMSTISNTDPFFGAGGPATASPGFAADIGIYAGLFGNAIELQLGIQNRFSNGTGSTGNYTLDIPYGEARLQISKLFFGVGYSPLVGRRADMYPGTANLSAVPQTTALLMEGGILFGITPLFSVGGKAALETITSSYLSGTSPTVTTFSVLLRFYFTISDGQKTSSEFKGWRYPFGREIF